MKRAFLCVCPLFLPLFAGLGCETKSAVGVGGVEVLADAGLRSDRVLEELNDPEILRQAFVISGADQLFEWDEVAQLFLPFEEHERAGPSVALRTPTVRKKLSPFQFARQVRLLDRLRVELVRQAEARLATLVLEESQDAEKRRWAARHLYETGMDEQFIGILKERMKSEKDPTVRSWLRIFVERMEGS